jgi:hypothetical protein
MTNGKAEFTEIEQLKLENFALRFNAAQIHLQQIMAERGAYINDILSRHPGYKWVEGEGLVAEQPKEIDDDEMVEARPQ